MKYNFVSRVMNFTRGKILVADTVAGSVEEIDFELIGKLTDEKAILKAMADYYRNLSIDRFKPVSVISFRNDRESRKIPLDVFYAESRKYN